MDVDSHGPPDDDGSAQPATWEETAADAQPGESLGSTGLSGSSASAPRTLLGAEAPPGLLAIEDIKPDEYYQASDQIREALQDLPEQIQQCEESQLASWVHTTDDYPDNLWMDCEYARKAWARAYNTVVIHDLLPYLDDYIMNAHDPFVEDFIWSMDDSRHTESKSRDSLKVMCRTFCFLQILMSSNVRTRAAGSVAQVAGRKRSFRCKGLCRSGGQAPP